MKQVAPFSNDYADGSDHRAEIAAPDPKHNSLDLLEFCDPTLHCGHLLHLGDRLVPVYEFAPRRLDQFRPIVRYGRRKFCQTCEEADRQFERYSPAYRLWIWRRDARKVLANGQVIDDTTLWGLLDAMPRTKAELHAVDGVTAHVAQAHGLTIVEALHDPFSRHARYLRRTVKPAKRPPLLTFAQWSRRWLNRRSEAQLLAQLLDAQAVNEEASRTGQDLPPPAQVVISPRQQRPPANGDTALVVSSSSATTESRTERLRRSCGTSREGRSSVYSSNGVDPIAHQLRAKGL